MEDGGWYGLGVLLAFLLWLWNAVYILITVNSMYERNLNKIGQRLSWVTFTPKPLDADYVGRSAVGRLGKYILIVGLGLPFILLSWFNVLLAIGMLIYRRGKDAGVPVAIKELRWKMRNVDMSFDQIVREMMKATDESPETFGQYRASVVEEMRGRGLRIL